MADTQVEEKDRSTVVVDGREVSEQEFEKIREEISSDPNRKLSEKAPGQYKVLNRLND